MFNTKTAPRELMAAPATVSADSVTLVWEKPEVYERVQGYDVYQNDRPVSYTHLWQDPACRTEDFYEEFAGQYYGENAAAAAGLYRRYAAAAIRFGDQEDETAGEQFYTHSVKILARQWMADAEKAAEHFQMCIRDRCYMIDFHCHLDLYKNPLAVFDEVKQRNVKVLAVTTSPRAYLKT